MKYKKSILYNHGLEIFIYLFFAEHINLKHS